MASLFKNPGKWIEDTWKSAERDWRNAGRGEVGRFVSGIGQSVFNIGAAVPRAIQSGKWDREFQRAGFSALNLSSGGVLDYAGRSSGIQRAIKQDEIIGKNVAAYARLTATGGREGKVSNADRNLAWQGAVKVAAATAAAYGGSAAYSYFSTPSAAASGSGTAMFTGGKVVPGVLTAPAYGSSGATAMTIGQSSLAATNSAAGISSAGFWGTTLGKALKGAGEFVVDTGKTLLSTQLIASAVGGKAQPGAPGGGGYYGGGVNVYTGPTTDPNPAPGSGPAFNIPFIPDGLNDVPKPVLYTGMAIGTLVVLKVSKVI